MRQVVTKIRRLSNGEVIAWTGDHECGLLLARLYEQGRIFSGWPDCQKDKDRWTLFVMASPGGLFVFEREPMIQKVEEPFWAFGCGRDYAMGAMANGADARQAVEITCRFDVNCGCGVDAFDVAIKG